jgi:hypothetical protein
MWGEEQQQQKQQEDINETTTKGSSSKSNPSKENLLESPQHERPKQIIAWLSVVCLHVSAFLLVAGFSATWRTATPPPGDSGVAQFFTLLLMWGVFGLLSAASVWGIKGGIEQQEEEENESANVTTTV